MDKTRKNEHNNQKLSADAPADLCEWPVLQFCAEKLQNVVDSVVFLWYSMGNSFPNEAFLHTFVAKMKIAKQNA